MCGFMGCYNPNISIEELGNRTRVAIDSLAHRGPDDSGVEVVKEGLSLAHRRLSILDLSPLGHQPYRSPRKGELLVYNGEIYNYHSIRSELEKETGYVFKSTGDTEAVSYTHLTLPTTPYV